MANEFPWRFCKEPRKTMTDEIRKTLAQLEAHGFKTKTFSTAEEMREFTLREIGTRSAGFGGSVTCDSLGLYEALASRGNAVWFHWKTATPEARAEALRNARSADVYLMSSNAISADGALLNIDGNGNRVGAMLDGPPTVFVLVGTNKFAASREDAMRRVKTVACPLNARRLHRQTPCATTGRCGNCRGPESMCHFTLWTEGPRKGQEIWILVADEPLGY